jgi:hypothetical protein
MRARAGTRDAIELAGQVAIGTHAGAQPPELGGGYFWPDADFLQTGGQGCPDNVTGHRCPGQSDTDYRCSPRGGGGGTWVA